jgi:hypothetical protein
MAVVNFSNVSSGFEPIEPGEYCARVDKVEEKIGQSSGKPYLNWTFEIFDNEVYKGRKCFYMTSLQEQSLWVLKKVLQAIGFSDDELNRDVELNDLLVDAIGMECIVKIDQEEYQGEMRDRVVDVKALQSSVDLYR